MKINKKKSKTLVLFDVGGVLLELNYSKLYKAGAKVSGETTENFKQKYIVSRIEPRVLSGEISHPQYLQELRILLGNESLTEGQLAKIIRNAWGDKISETIELKKQIAEKGYSVGIFSNANQFAIDILSKEFPEMFETYNTGPKIYSYQIGDVKPNIPMYEAIQEMRFNSIVYLDDNQDYVKKGLEFGWNGILFTPYVDNAEAIRSEKGHDNRKINPKIKVADSIEKLVSSLSDFGIPLK